MQLEDMKKENRYKYINSVWFRKKLEEKHTENLDKRILDEPFNKLPEGTYNIIFNRDGGWDYFFIEIKVSRLWGLLWKQVYIGVTKSIGTYTSDIFIWDDKTKIKLIENFNDIWKIINEKYGFQKK